MKKIEKAVPYKEKVYEELKAAIIDHKLRPGELLNERHLADSLGVSRTPVREALRMLENEGWVATEAWKGTYVTEISEHDIQEIFQLRIALESLAAEAIAGRASQEQINKLEEFYEEQNKLKDNGRSMEFIKIDSQFHKFIVELTGNKRMHGIICNIEDMMERIGIVAIKSGHKMEEIMNEHDDIIKALKEGTGDEAKQAMNRHLSNTMVRVSENLNLGSGI